MKSLASWDVFGPSDRIKFWIEHVTIGFLYVRLIVLTMLFYSGVPGFATDCNCGVWCCGLTTCLLYLSPLFWKLVLNDSWFVSLTWGGTHIFSLFLIVFMHKYLHRFQHLSIWLYLFFYLIFTIQRVIYFYQVVPFKVYSFKWWYMACRQ